MPDEVISISVIDVTGRILVDEKMMIRRRELHENFNLSVIQPGVYLLKITTASNEFVRRFIVSP
jgi:hypothetical protein